jgi:hypothetical protein
MEPVAAVGATVAEPKMGDMALRTLDYQASGDRPTPASAYAIGQGTAGANTSSNATQAVGMATAVRQIGVSMKNGFFSDPRISNSFKEATQGVAPDPVEMITTMRLVSQASTNVMLVSQIAASAASITKRLVFTP